MTEYGLTNPHVLLLLSLKGKLYPLLLDLEQEDSIRVQALGTLQAWQLQETDDGLEMRPIPPFILENTALVASGEVVALGITDIIGCILSKIFSLDKLCKYLTCVALSGTGLVGCLTNFLPESACDLLGTLDELVNCVSSSPAPSIPTLSVNPTTQSAGLPINYSGIRYSPGATVNILVYRQSGGATQPLLFSTVANGFGQISGSFNPGSTTAPGNYVVIGQDSSKGYSKGVNIVITQPNGGGSQGTCANPYTLTSGVAFSGNTSGGQTSFNAYNCTSWNENGPERVHRITLNSPGTMAVALSDCVKPTVRRTTYNSYEQQVRVQVAPFLGHHQLTKLESQHIQTYKNEKAKPVPQPDKEKPKPGLSTKDDWLSSVCSGDCAQTSATVGLAVRNVATLVDPPRPLKYEIQPITPEQARQFLEAIKGNRLEALFTVALSLGLRSGEALGLRCQDIDSKNARCVFISRLLESTRSWCCPNVRLKARAEFWTCPRR